MNYHPDDFLALIEEVEQQGGVHLANEVCKPQNFRLNLPVEEGDPKGAKANQRLSTTGCRRRAKFLVPLLPDAYVDEIDLLNNAQHGSYDSDGKRRVRDAEEEDFSFSHADHPLARMADGTPVLAKVCAVDDAMGLWPRFNDVLHTGESFQEF